MDIAKRYGKMSNPTESIEGDLVFCLIQDQLMKERFSFNSGISNEATVSIDSISEKNIKKSLKIKNDDKLQINVKKVFTNATDLSAMLKLSQAELKKIFKMIYFNLPS